MQYQRLLLAIAYRMLGSVMEAEDIVQDAFLRWQRTPEIEVQSAKAYLTTIVTRLCIDHARLARVQREEYIGPWLPELFLAGSAQDLNENPALSESLSPAFLLLMESLTPLERAVFLLHEVFAYSHAEIAAAVDQSEANCRQMLHRARRSIAAKRRRVVFSREQHERLVSQFIQTCASGDMDSLLTLLANDITFQSDGGGKVTAAPNLIHGSQNVARFVFGLLRKAPGNFAMVSTEVNAQPAIIAYVNGNVYGILTFNVIDNHIQDIYFLVNPDKLTGIPPLT